MRIYEEAEMKGYEKEENKEEEVNEASDNSGTNIIVVNILLFIYYFRIACGINCIIFATVAFITHYVHHFVFLYIIYGRNIHQLQYIIIFFLLKLQFHVDKIICHKDLVRNVIKNKIQLQLNLD